MKWSDQIIIGLLNDIKDHPGGTNGTVAPNQACGSVADQEIIRVLTNIRNGTDVLNNWDRMINLWSFRGSH